MVIAAFFALYISWTQSGKDKKEIEGESKEYIQQNEDM